MATKSGLISSTNLISSSSSKKLPSWDSWDSESKIAIEEGFFLEARKSTPNTDISSLHVRESDILVSLFPVVRGIIIRESPVEVSGRAKAPVGFRSVGIR
jgi:hypothetical protein